VEHPGLIGTDAVEILDGGTPTVCPVMISPRDSFRAQIIGAQVEK
jgi:hypothetical protein